MKKVLLGLVLAGLLVMPSLASAQTIESMVSRIVNIVV